ncbi:MAG: germination protein YpeB [Clostridia bacterium]|nr:germination protein YpeB [Clostridia bacterium]
MKRWIVPVLSLCLAVSVAAAGAMYIRERRVRRTLEGISRAALWEVSEEMQSLTLSLEKAAVSGSHGQEAALLAAISRSAGDVCRCLTVLPLSHAAMSPTLAFANQLSDWAQSMLPRAAEGGLTDEDRRQLQSHQALCRQLTAQIVLAQADAERSGFTRLADETFYAPADADARPLERIADQDHGMQYPALIYDGAFSDARRSGEPRGLPDTTVTAEDALVIAAEFVGRDRVTAAAPAPDAGGSLPAWGVTIQTADVQLNLEVTRQGGKVLWMMPETARFQQLQSIESCRRAAADFLAQRGFGSMESTQHQVYDGLCVLNFAPVQDGVLLYPDLVKVQVRMDAAEVVGLEAHHYWMNHVRRELPEPAVSAGEAQANLAAGLTAGASRLCLIPWHADERLCWEFDCTAGDSRYLVYIDALTGEEIDILKVIPLSQGTLVSRQIPPHQNTPLHPSQRGILLFTGHHAITTLSPQVRQTQHLRQRGRRASAAASAPASSANTPNTADPLPVISAQTAPQSFSASTASRISGRKDSLTGCSTLRRLPDSAIRSPAARAAAAASLSGDAGLSCP